MNSQDIFIIITASLIGVLYLMKVRSYDIYEKESFVKLLIVAIAGGIISVFTSLFIYEFVDVNRNFGDAIIKIGLIEESSKLIALMIIYYYIKKDFNEIVDGIIYITAISLGFAIIENIFYVINSDTPLLLLFQRSVFSIIGHISFSGYMGIAYYIHKRVATNYIGIGLSIALASLAHGFYDGFIFHEELNFLFQFVFIGLIILQLWLLKTTLGFSKFRVKLEENTFKETDKMTFLYCCNCDSGIKSKELKFWKIRAGKCDTCNNIVFGSENIKRLFEYFRPILKVKKYLKKLSKHDRITNLDYDKKILFHTERYFLSADTKRLGTWLDESNTNDRLNILKIPVIGIVLKYLGLRYIIDN